LENILKQFK